MAGVGSCDLKTRDYAPVRRLQFPHSVGLESIYLLAGNNVVIVRMLDVAQNSPPGAKMPKPAIIVEKTKYIKFCITKNKKTK